jgi:hypothetical protein
MVDVFRLVERILRLANSFGGRIMRFVLASGYYSPKERWINDRLIDGIHSAKIVQSSWIMLMIGNFPGLD